MEPQISCVCVCRGARKLTVLICLLQISSNITECDYDTEKDKDHEGREHNAAHQNSSHTNKTISRPSPVLSVSQPEINRKTSQLLSITVCHCLSLFVRSKIQPICAARVRRVCTQFCSYYGGL